MDKNIVLIDGRKYRKGIYSIDVVLGKYVDAIKSKSYIADFDGDHIIMKSDRYKMFKAKGVSCSGCGIKGQYFAKETFAIGRLTHIDVLAELPETEWKLYLYAIDQDGNEVPMTIDHILPVAQGGISHISNYSTMCTYCNCEKGNMNKKQWAFYKAQKIVYVEYTTQELAAKQHSHINKIIELQAIMATKGKNPKEYNHDPAYKDACTLSTLCSRIIKARNNDRQSIWSKSLLNMCN